MRVAVNGATDTGSMEKNEMRRRCNRRLSRSYGLIRSPPYAGDDDGAAAESSRVLRAGLLSDIVDMRPGELSDGTFGPLC